MFLYIDVKRDDRVYELRGDILLSVVGNIYEGALVKRVLRGTEGIID